MMSHTEKEIKNIMDRFNIKLNRFKSKEDRQKAYNQCKDNEKVFFEYKKDEKLVFPKKQALEPYEIDQKRRKFINKIVIQLRKDQELVNKKFKKPKTEALSPEREVKSKSYLKMLKEMRE